MNKNKAQGSCKEHKLTLVQTVQQFQTVVWGLCDMYRVKACLVKAALHFVLLVLILALVLFSYLTLETLYIIVTTLSISDEQRND